MKKDINEVFKYNITDLVSSFLDNARIYFSNLRNAEAEYNDNINGLVSYYLSDLEDEAHIPVHLVHLIRDKDTLITTLASSHDVHLRVSIEKSRKCLKKRIK